MVDYILLAVISGGFIMCLFFRKLSHLQPGQTKPILIDRISIKWSDFIVLTSSQRVKATERELREIVHNLHLCGTAIYFGEKQANFTELWGDDGMCHVKSM